MRSTDTLLLRWITRWRVALTCVELLIERAMAVRGRAGIVLTPTLGAAAAAIDSVAGRPMGRIAPSGSIATASSGSDEWANVPFRARRTVQSRLDVAMARSIHFSTAELPLEGMPRGPPV